MTPREGMAGDARPRRIVVVGSSNAGKSTLAARLARSLEAPFVELDAIYWLPNWVGRDDEDFGARVREAVAGDSWVVAGNYRRVAQPFIWPRAELVGSLDLPLRTTLPRLIRRSWERSHSGELLWGTNTESFWKHLKLWDQEQSLIAFLLRNHRAQRKRYLDAMRDPQWSHIRFVHLRSEDEVEAFTRDFEAADPRRPEPREPVEQPRKFVVLGGSGSGKSTLAERLATAMDAPYVELDALHWQPNWTPTPLDEFAAKIYAATPGDRWVVAGNYSRVSDKALWPRADCMVVLDLPLRTIFPRMFRRTWRRWRTHELLWGTNYEDPWQHLRLWETDKNLFSYTLLHHNRGRRRYREMMRDPQWAHLRWIWLRSPREIDAFTQGFEAAARGS